MGAMPDSGICGALAMTSISDGDPIPGGCGRAVEPTPPDCRFRMVRRSGNDRATQLSSSLPVQLVNESAVGSKMF